MIKEIKLIRERERVRESERARSNREAGKDFKKHSIIEL